jgi:predicted lipoprotein
MNAFLTSGNSASQVLLLGLLITLGMAACVTPDPIEEDYDRKPLLESVADNLIIPNFESIKASVDALSEAADAFVQTTDEANLIALQGAWVQAVRDHQHCSAFSFGPAEILLGPYAEVLGVFPVSEEKIEQRILDPDFDLANSFDIDVRGFYAVEYLIYGKASNSEVLASFDQNRKDYLLLIVAELKNTFDQVVEEWNDSYRQAFINNDGTSAGSSISLYYNSFVKDYENAKNFKLEIPAGLSAGIAADERLVEAYYSGISRELVVENFESSKNIWLGLSRDGQEILGFRDYLESLVGGPELITATLEGIARIDEAITNLPQGPLSDQVESEEVKALRDAYQANTANFKSSMVSLTGIDITFNSGDGD